MVEAFDTALEARVGNELRNIGIPPCPAVLLKLHSETAKDEPDFNRLANIMGDDVALSAGLIKVANSPYFGFQKKVRSIHEAMLVIGLKTIIHAVAGLQLEKAFEHVARLERFWHSSAQTARTAAWLATQMSKKSLRSVDTYTYGLFHNCGVPLLAAPFKDYLGVLQQANEAATGSFTQIEDEHFGMNHAMVGAEMAKEWLLPEEICVGILHHHDVDAIAGRKAEIGSASRQLIAVGHLAEHLNHLHTGLNFSREWEKLGDACLAVLGVGSETYERLCDESASALTDA